MSRGELAHVAGISESYLKKIEKGDRSPEIEIYRRITEVLDVDIAIRNSDGTVKGECAERAHKIFLKSTEKQTAMPGGPVYSGPHWGEQIIKPWQGKRRA